MITLADWIARHPYLRPVAELHASVDRALETVSIPAAAAPDWPTYADDFQAGVPLLQSTAVTVDLTPIEPALRSLLSALSSTPLASRAHDAGWLTFLTAMISARHLRPLVRAFDGWRDDEKWMRNSCPTCGSGPAMGQLVGKDPGRLRFLWCGRCRTHWQYRRTACPFCENRDDHRLAALDVEGENGLRLDQCESCGGYLKSYNGAGSEGVLLADWTSLHLDVLARDRGLKRLATSLYEI